MRTMVLLGLGWSPAAWAVCAATGDVRINELMPDPSNAGGDADAEWVELVHRGTEPLDLSGWAIERATSPEDYDPALVVPEGTVLQPGQRLVLAGPAATLPSEDGVLRVTQEADMGNASSSSDAVRLVTCDGAVIDVVAYGSVNSGTFVDEELEEIADFKLAPKPSSGKSLARIPDGSDTNNGFIDFARVDPTPGAENVGGGSAPGGCAESSIPAGARIVINELLPDPGAQTNPSGSSDSGYEWVELYNAGSVAVPLAGWQIQQAGAPDDWGSRIKATIGPITLEPGAFLLIADPLFPIPEGVAASVIGGTTLGLGNSEDGVRLVDCAGRTADEVVYGGANPDGFTDADGAVLADDRIAPKVASDQSLARRADGLDSDDHAADFAIAGPTPGEANPDLRCKERAGKVLINELMPNPAGTDSEAANEWVELYNTSVGEIDISGWMIAKATSKDAEGTLNQTVLFTFPPGTTVGPSDFLVVGGLAAAETDLFTDPFDLPSGSGGDLVLLLDCEGERADSVLYGGENEDALTEDDGWITDEGADAADDDQCIARVSDGTDTDVSAEDFKTTRYCTIGATNLRETPDVPDDPDPVGGCGGPQGPREVSPRDAGPGSGCSTAPRYPVFLLALSVLLRRVRRSG